MGSPSDVNPGIVVWRNESGEVEKTEFTDEDAWWHAKEQYEGREGYELYPPNDYGELGNPATRPGFVPDFNKQRTKMGQGGIGFSSDGRGPQTGRDGRVETANEMGQSPVGAPHEYFGPIGLVPSQSGATQAELPPEVRQEQERRAALGLKAPEIQGSSGESNEDRIKRIKDMLARGINPHTGLPDIPGDPNELPPNVNNNSEYARWLRENRNKYGLPDPKTNPDAYRKYMGWSDSDIERYRGRNIPIVPGAPSLGHGGPVPDSPSGFGNDYPSMSRR